MDAFLLTWLQTKLGLDFNDAGGVLMDMRAYREKTTGKRQGPTKASDWVMPDGVEQPLEKQLPMSR
jgi:hypothetical protein